MVVRPKGDQAKAVRVQASDSAGFLSSSFRFEPDKLTVQAGTTLVVGNVGGKPHTLTADDGSFDSGVIVTRMRSISRKGLKGLLMNSTAPACRPSRRVLGVA